MKSIACQRVVRPTIYSNVTMGRLN